MATVLDDALLPAVFNLLNTLGKDLQYSIPKAGEYDVADGSLVRGNPDVFTVKSIPPFMAKDMFNLSSLLKQSSRVTGVAGSGLAFTPAENIQVTLDNELFVIDVVEPIYSGESVVLWLFGLKRGGKSAG